MPNECKIDILIRTMTPIFESALLIYSEDNILSYRMVKMRFFLFWQGFFLPKPYRLDIIDSQKMFTFFQVSKWSLNYKWLVKKETLTSESIINQFENRRDRTKTQSINSKLRLFKQKWALILSADNVST